MSNIRVSAMDDLDSKEDTNNAKSLNAGSSQGQINRDPDILISRVSEEQMSKKSKTEHDILITKLSEEQMRKKNISEEQMRKKNKSQST